MLEAKSISLFDLTSGQPEKTLELPGMAAATPCYSSDGKSLVFAASPSVKIVDDYEKQIAVLSKRQIEIYQDGKTIPLTDDGTYRSEAPAFLKNNNYIIFARVSSDGERSVWLMGSDGDDQKPLSGGNTAIRTMTGLDFYGRVDWSNMFNVFDDTKTD